MNYGNSIEYPLILITNDDGYDAPGIHALVRAMASIGEVFVVAPDGARSGMACAISSNKIVTVRELPSEYVDSVLGIPVKATCTVKPRMFACTGTPVDCVKLALERVVPRVPDLLVSGINAGDNASISVHYSGTMGAVFEACMKDIPAIGFSLLLRHGETYNDHPVPADALAAITSLCQRVIDDGLPVDVCLNVNIPPLEQFNGFRMCRQTKGLWSGEWADVPGMPDAFTLTGHFTDLEPTATDTDFAALRAGFCSVVPVTIDLTAHGYIEELKPMTEEHK